MIKSEYRAIMRNARNQLEGKEIVQRSNTIIQRFSASKYYQESKLIMTYVSFGSEVVTKGLIEQMFRDNKRIAVPLCLPKMRNLIACEIESFDELAPGTLGILEPVDSAVKEVDVSHIDIVIVPALAFDRRLDRLGHGAGYYDRFLSRLSKGTFKVGLSYDLQLIEKLPKEKHDMPLDIIVTESELIIACNKSRTLV